MIIIRTMITIVFTNLVFMFSAYAIDSGEYIHTHEVGAFERNGEMKFREVTNTLSIINNNNEISFNITIFAPNHHSCHIKGKAKKENEHFVYKEEIRWYPEGRKIGDCMLEIHNDGDELYLLDKDLVCRKKYCGARGGLNGERFEKKVK